MLRLLLLMHTRAASAKLQRNRLTKVLLTAMMLNAIAISPIPVTTGEPTKAADPAPTTIAKRAVKVYVARVPLSSGLPDGSWLMQGTLAPHDALAHVSGKSHG